MTKDEVVRYWVESSGQDYRVMESLFANGHYVWSLFVGHLVVEKLLKAYYVKGVDVDVPRSHNLTKLAAMSGLTLTSEQEDFLDEVTEFNITARYADYRGRFYRKATHGFTEKYVTGIKEFRTWLMSLIKT